MVFMLRFKICDTNTVHNEFIKEIIRRWIAYEKAIRHQIE